MTYGLYSYGVAAYGASMTLFQTGGLTAEERIELALFKSVHALQLTEELPRAWPNVPFTPSSPLSTYIRVQHLPNVNTRLASKSDDPHLRQGILQLTVVSPLRLGPSPSRALASTIAYQYPADLALFESGAKVRIQSAPDVVSPEKTDVSWDARVDVRYECLI